MAKRKLYGLCKTCKDQVECFKPFKDQEHPDYGMEKPSCDARDKEIHQKFLNWTDEYGNTEMYKLDLTKEEKIELQDWLLKEEDNYGGNASIIYNQNLSHYQYRHDKSEYIYKKIGVETPTPNDSTIDEEIEWYAHQYTQRGVCKECIVRPNCSKFCDAKREERRAEVYKIERMKDSGLCKKCVIRLSCLDEKNCIDREQEIKKSEKLNK